MENAIRAVALASLVSLAASSGAAGELDRDLARVQREVENWVIEPCRGVHAKAGEVPRMNRIMHDGKTLLEIIREGAVEIVVGLEPLDRLGIYNNYLGLCVRAMLIRSGDFDGGPLP